MPMLGWRASKLQQNIDEKRGRKLPERGTSAGREARESFGAAPLLLTYEGRGVNFFRASKFWGKVWGALGPWFFLISTQISVLGVLLAFSWRCSNATLTSSEKMDKRGNFRRV